MTLKKFLVFVGATIFVSTVFASNVGGAVRASLWALGHSSVLAPLVEEAGPLLDTRVSEITADESLSTTPERIDCGKSNAPRTWKCIDTATGGITVYRGDSSVSSSTGFPESADAAFGGDSRAYLVLAASTLTVRCVCGE